MKYYQHKDGLFQKDGLYQDKYILAVNDEKRACFFVHESGLIESAPLTTMVNALDMVTLGFWKEIENPIKLQIEG